MNYKTHRVCARYSLNLCVIVLANFHGFIHHFFDHPSIHSLGDNTIGRRCMYHIQSQTLNYQFIYFFCSKKLTNLRLWVALTLYAQRYGLTFLSKGYNWIAVTVAAYRRVNRANSQLNQPSDIRFIYAYIGQCMYWTVS